MYVLNIFTTIRSVPIYTTLQIFIRKLNLFGALEMLLFNFFNSFLTRLKKSNNYRKITFR